MSYPHVEAARLRASLATAGLFLAVFVLVSSYGGSFALSEQSPGALAQRAAPSADLKDVRTLRDLSPKTTLDGVDVSSYQNTIDWTSVAADGITFAFARAVEYYGTPDSDFDTYMTDGNAAGVIMGAYDFVYPASETASTDADYFNSIIKAYVADGYMYPALDLEEDCTASGGSLDASQITTWVNSWGTEMESDLASDGYSGVVPTVYMNTNYAENCIDASTWGGWNLWIADYCGCSSPGLGVFSNWNYWQYSDDGTVSGISGGNDMDYFNGDLSQLQSGFIFGGTTSVTASYSMEDLTTSTALTCGGTFLTGDSIQFTASASGSSGTYTYQWNFGDKTTGTGSPVTHIYTATGTVNPMLWVNASGGGKGVTGTGCSFTVTAGLSISSPLSATPSTITLGNSTTFKVAATGGNTPYSYAYTGLPAGCNSANASSLPCTPTATGTFSVTVTVKDSLKRTVTSSTSLTVTATPLVISAFSATPSSVLENGTTTLSVTVSGGVTPYTYVYAGLPAGCTSSDVATLKCTPTAIGNFTITVTVTDTSSQTQKSSTVLQVTAGPLAISSFTATPSDINLGNGTTLAVAFGGGIGPYSIAYSGLPPGCLSANTSDLGCTPTDAGNFTITVTVTDASSQSQSSSTTLRVALLPLSISSFLATPSDLILGNSTVLGVTFAGGIGPYSFAYAGLPVGCLSSNVSDLTCTPLRAGTFQVTVTVTDGRGATASQSVQFLVYELVELSATSPPPVPLGSPVTLTVTVKNGTPPYSYLWIGLPKGCATVNSSKLTCTPAEEGTTNVTIQVTDALDHLGATYLLLSVVPPALAIVSFTATPTSFVLGNSTTLAVGVSGGSPPYTYHYTDLPEGCSSSNASSLVCTPTVAGNFSVSVTVVDTRSVVEQASLSFTVLSPSTSKGPGGGTGSPLPLSSTDFFLLAIVAAGVAIGIAVAVRRRGSPPEEVPPTPGNFAPWEPPNQG